MTTVSGTETSQCPPTWASRFGCGIRHWTNSSGLCLNKSFNQGGISSDFIFSTWDLSLGKVAVTLYHSKSMERSPTRWLASSSGAGWQRPVRSQTPYLIVVSGDDD